MENSSLNNGKSSGSPLPLRSSARLRRLSNTSVSTQPSSTSTASNIFEKFDSSKPCDSHKRSCEDILKSDKDNIESGSDTVHQLINISNDNDSQQCSQQSQFSDFSCSQTTDDCGNDNDEFYMPPRKKLRSEVRKDELWDGFPLGFSFKRLAPLSRKSESDADNRSYTTGVDSQSDVEDRYETAADSPYRKETDSEEPDYQVDSSLESTIIYAETDSRESHVEESHRTSKHDTEQLLIPAKCKDQTYEEYSQRTSEATNNHTPRSNKQKIVDSPKTPRKSLRLMQKFNLTPNKNVDNPCSTQTTPNEASHTLSFDDKSRSESNKVLSAYDIHRQLEPYSAQLTKDVIKDKKEATDNNHACLQDSSFKVVPENSTITDDIEENHFKDNEDRHDDIVLKESIDNSDDTDNNESTPKYDMMMMSYSQILTCDNEEITMSQESERNQALSDQSSRSNDVHESVSRVLDHLLNVVESKSDHLQSSKNLEYTNTPSCSYQTTHTDKITDNGSINTQETKKRRSNRIAVLENKQSLREIGTEQESTRQETLPSNDNLKQVSANQDEAAVSSEGPGTAFSKKTSHKADKCKENKLVPSLRIKLKFPWKCVPNKSKSKTNSKEKQIDVTRSGSKDEINVPSTSKESPAKQKSKKRKKQHKSSKTSDESSIEDTEATNKNKESKSKKKGHAPINTRKTKRTKKETTNCPSVTNVSLRLNNERRAAAAGKLINNAVLDRHACVLWSSENRRHVQLSNSGASPCDLDEILRRKWENLSPKEKLRYFQRAKDAVRDENKHSNKRFKDEDDPSTSGSNNDSANPDLDRFLSLDSRSQLSELKSRLHFYREVSPEEYTKVMSSYKASCVSVRQEKETKKPETSKARSKQKKNKRKTSEPETNDTHAKYRRLLYEKVCENWNKIVGIWQDKKRVQTSILYENFKLLIRRLIADEPVQFCEHTVSVRLSEVLYDLRQLERGKQLVVSGVHPEREHQHVIHRLCEMSSQAAQHPVTESTLLDVPIDTRVMNKVLSELKEDPLPMLDLDSLQTVVPITSDVSSSCPPVEVRYDVRNPATILTEWVVEEAISSNQHLESRGAISLLTNKVVPGSTFVAPKNGNGAHVHRDINSSKTICNSIRFYDESAGLREHSSQNVDSSKQVHFKQIQRDSNEAYDKSKQAYNENKETNVLVQVRCDSKQKQEDSSKVSDKSIESEADFKQLQDDSISGNDGSEKTKDDNNNCEYVTRSPDTVLKYKAMRTVLTQRQRPKME